MPIKKSAIWPLALAVGSGTLLVLNPTQNIAPSKRIQPVKCCQFIKEREPFTAWDIFSQSMFKTKV